MLNLDARPSIGSEIALNGSQKDFHCDSDLWHEKRQESQRDL